RKLSQPYDPRRWIRKIPVSLGAPMVTRKIATKKLQRVQILKFRKEWLIDPGPDGYIDLTRQAIRDIAQAKKDFAARMNEIFATGRK
ncbi:MAG TPA: hypothetical protein VFT02_04935, partial [Pyrinomonadaceae bacterium]|nr:hypothetical protein [Pyrinomonadaceae bacterium]